MMNWNKGHELYSKIKELRKQYDLLGELATQIAEDKGSIDVAILHSEYQYPRQNNSIFFSPFEEEEDYSKRVDIEPARMTLYDEHALSYIGNQMRFIEGLISKLEQKLESL